MRTKEIATKPHASDRTFVIGFKVSPEDHQNFMESYQPGKEYQVEITRYFEKSSKGQKNFFHKLLRSLSEKMKMPFEETKQWFITEYGFPEEDGDGYLFAYLDKETNPPNMFKAQSYYFKVIEETDSQMKYLAYKGISMLNTREMNLMLDFLKSECDSQGIKVCSDTEYKNLKEQWSEKD